ncbi:hypothetical protein STEG23_034847 [Scotinomys teguina]
MIVSFEKTHSSPIPYVYRKHDIPWNQRYSNSELPNVGFVCRSSKHRNLPPTPGCGSVFIKGMNGMLILQFRKKKRPHLAAEWPSHSTVDLPQRVPPSLSGSFMCGVNSGSEAGENRKQDYLPATSERQKQLRLFEKNTERTHRLTLDINNNNTRVSKTLDINNNNTRVSKTLDINNNNTRVSKTLDINNNNTRVSKTLDINNNTTRVSKTLDINNNTTRVSKTLDIKNNNTRVSKTLDINNNTTRVSKTLDINNNNTRVSKTLDINNNTTRVSKTLDIYKRLKILGILV